jgi:hypothetical protein
MAQFNNQRLRGLRIGISSYTEDELVLDVIGNTNIVGLVTGKYFSGDGSGLSAVRIGIQTAGSNGPIGTGASILDFRGDSIDTITVTSGISTISINTPISPIMMGMIF